jgi:hypothetical protein
MTRKAAHVKELAKARQKLYTTRKADPEFAKTAAEYYAERNGKNR